jgi:hypothetical protein
MKTLKKLALSLVIGIMGVQTSFAVDMAGLGTAVAKDAGSALAGQVGSSPGVKVGIRAGLNLADVAYKNDYSEGDRSYTSSTAWYLGNLIGFHVGPVVDVKMLEFLYLQPGVMFSLKGADMEEESKSGSDKRTRKTTISAYYIDVPLNLSLKGYLAPNLALRAHVGPYAGFGLFGEEEQERKDSGYPQGDKKEKKKLFEKEKNAVCDYDYNSYEEVCSVKEYAMLNRFNMGIGFGVGIEISDFYIGVNYNYGLTSLTTDDFNKNDEGIKAYERTLGISLGYGF